MLSNSLKTSLSEFFFSSWTLQGPFFFFLLRFIAVEKSLFLYCVILIEIILRLVAGCHSLDYEFHSAIGNKESVENNIIFHFCFCLLPIKIALAIRWSTFSQELFGGSWLYVIVIYECLGHVELFMRSMQFVPALLHMNQVMKCLHQILKTCLWPNVSCNFVFVIRRKLIIIKHRYEFRFLKLTS